MVWLSGLSSAYGDLALKEYVIQSVMGPDHSINYKGWLKMTGAIEPAFCDGLPARNIEFDSLYADKTKIYFYENLKPGEIADGNGCKDSLYCVWWQADSNKMIVVKPPVRIFKTTEENLRKKYCKE